MADHGLNLRTAYDMLVQDYVTKAIADATSPLQAQVVALTTYRDQLVQQNQGLQAQHATDLAAIQERNATIDELGEEVDQLQARIAELEGEQDDTPPPTIFSLDASPAPGSNWAADAAAKQALFADAAAPAPAFNIARGVFASPGQTLSWTLSPTAAAFAAQRKGDAILCSKKGSVSLAEMKALFDHPRVRDYALFMFIFNHEIKPADMSVAAWTAQWNTVHQAYDESPNKDKIRLVANFNHYQIEHAGFNYKTYLDPISSAIHYYSEDIYNEAWLSSTGYETAANVLGGFLQRAEAIKQDFGLRSAVVEFGADQVGSDAAGLLKVYKDSSDLFRSAGIAWVGFWADNAKTPVWHTDPAHVVFKYVQEQLRATRGLAARL
jgi:hypothetical protein